jgi:hypothetical protein
MTSSANVKEKNPISEQFKEIRNRTLELVKTLEKDDFVVQQHFHKSANGT